MKTQPIVLKNLTVAELCILEVYVQNQAYGSPFHETPRQAEKRMAEQERWRATLKRIRLALKQRTKEIV